MHDRGGDDRIELLLDDGSSKGSLFEPSDVHDPTVDRSNDDVDSRDGPGEGEKLVDELVLEVEPNVEGIPEGDEASGDEDGAILGTESLVKDEIKTSFGLGIRGSCRMR